MKKTINVKIEHNCEMIPGVYEMCLLAPEVVVEASAGQFLELYTGKAELLLPRPISICEVNNETGRIRLVYQLVGKGTQHFSTLEDGDYIKVMGSLGEGFDLERPMLSVAVVGGGMGTAPIVQLVKEIQLKNPGCETHVYLGFRNASSVILKEDFEAWGAVVHIATDDGSTGLHGNAVDLLRSAGQTPEMIYGCGPLPMLHALAAFAAEKDIPCQVSMEERMACGIGACVGCAIKIRTPDGEIYKKVCKDGPVFDAREVVWDE